MERLKNRVQKRKKQALPVLFLKIDDDIVRLNNTLNTTNRMRNDYCDQRRAAKGDADERARLTVEIEKMDKVMADLRRRIDVLIGESNDLAYDLAYQRLMIYVLADALYGVLFDTREWAKEYCKPSDETFLKRLQAAMDDLFAFPAEIGTEATSRANNAYSELSDNLLAQIDANVRAWLFVEAAKIGIKVPEKYKK
jgi:hypothetical protein